MPTQIAQAEGIHPYLLGTDTPIGVDAAGTRWSISYRGKNAILLATFNGGATLEFKVPTDAVNKSGSVAAFTIPNFGDAQWVTYAEHVKFEVRFPTPPKVTEVSVNVARQSCELVSDGAGGLDVLSAGVKVGALPRPWIEYVPDGSQDRTRLWLDWVVAEPTMRLTMPTLTASEWATAVLDPTVITTSTASTATAYSNQRKIDRTQNGVLWAMFWDGTSNTADSMHFRYSTDDGATWSDGGGFGFAGTGATYVPNGSLFIDVDDYAHVVYKDNSNGYIYYRRGTPNAGRTAWTWSGATALSTSSTNYNYPDLVAFRNGTGWRMQAVVSRVEGATNYVYQFPFDISSGGTITAATASAVGNYDNSNHTYPSIDFNHTGDSKTVTGGTPHLYAAWSAGATGAGKGIRFKKATYSGGTWTWGTEREIDSTAAVTNANEWIAAAFDGSRFMIASNSGYKAKVWQRDAADTATSSWAGADFDYLIAGSMSYDASGNVYILGRDNRGSSGTQGLVYRRWTRGTGAFDPVSAIETTAPNNPYVSAKRGYSNNRIEFVYTDGTASPHSVTYDSILLTVPPNQGAAVVGYDYTVAAVGQANPVGSAVVGYDYTVTATGTAPTIPVPTGTTVIGVNWAVKATSLSTPAGSATITYQYTVTGAGAAPVVLYRFTPPTQQQGVMHGDRLFDRYSVPVGLSVVKRDGVYTTIPYPWLGELAGLKDGRDYFLGGRDYTIPEDIAQALTADGYTPVVI